MMRPSSQPPILLCTDFDETITQHDTTSLLFQLVASSSDSAQQLITQYDNEIDQLIRRYESTWQQHNHRSNFIKSFDRAGLYEFLTEYAAVDVRSVQRVVENEALKGIRLEDLNKLTNDVRVRPNCAETLAMTEEWKIVSVNWSRKLVEAVMTQTGVAYDTTQIIANELEVDDLGVTTGRINVKVQSPMDKERYVDQSRSMHVGIYPTVVYVGDSATDLLALLAADVGIWFVSDHSTSSAKLLRQLVKYYGIGVHPLIDCSSFGDCIAKTSVARPVLFSITDWAQLKSILKSAC